MPLRRQTIELTDLHVYIDGSGRHKPRRGGIGIRFVYLDSSYTEKTENFDYPGFRAATNNQMELTACIKAFDEILKYPNIEKFSKIKIFSDSSYVVDNQNKAIYIWSKNQYRKASSGLVENADIWKKWVKDRIKLSKMLRGVPIDLQWKNRCSNDHMKVVDKLAKNASLACSGAPFRAIGVRRNRLPVKSGKVNFFGQKMTIYVVTAEPMKVQKMNKYSCQVISKGSPDYGRKGTIYSPTQLKEGHRYTVTCIEHHDDPGICDIQIHRRYKTKKEVLELLKKNIAKGTYGGQVTTQSL